MDTENGAVGVLLAALTAKRLGEYGTGNVGGTDGFWDSLLSVASHPPAVLRLPGPPAAGYNKQT